MVLKKVGEFLTTINVNGEQKVSTNQSDDQTYDLTDYQNVNIEFNNDLKDSFSINNDSTFNISASASSDIVETVLQETSTNNWFNSPTLSGGKYRYECNEGINIDISHPQWDNDMFFNNSFSTSFEIFLPADSQITFRISDSGDLPLTLYRLGPSLSFNGVSQQ